MTKIKTEIMTGNKFYVKLKGNDNEHEKDSIM